MSWRSCSCTTTLEDKINIGKELELDYNEIIDGWVDDENKVLYLFEFQDRLWFKHILKEKFETKHDIVMMVNDYSRMNCIGQYEKKPFNTTGIIYHYVFTDKEAELYKEYNGYHIVSVETYSDDWEIYAIDISLNEYINNNEVVSEDHYAYVDDSGRVVFSRGNEDINYKRLRFRIHG